MCFGFPVINYIDALLYRRPSVENYHSLFLDRLFSSLLANFFFFVLSTPTPLLILDTGVASGAAAQSEEGLNEVDAHRPLPRIDE